MRADNSIHLVDRRPAAPRTTPGPRRSRRCTNSTAPARVLTFESVARHAGVSRSWIYTQTDIKDEIRRLRDPNRRQPSTPIPAPQRASDDSLRQRLEIANRRNRELADENQRLRRQLVPRPRPTPRQRSSTTRRAARPTIAIR